MLDKNSYEFIEELTRNDTKSLPEKTVKLLSEAGELASKVLTYESLSGAKHRFSTREGIIDEVADNILVAMSVGIDVGMTMDDLTQALQAKSNHWHKVQATKATNTFPFEIHITVKPVEDIEQYKIHCAIVGVKPILLDLQLNGNAVMKDLMTSSVFVGTNRSVMEEAERICNELTAFGYEPIRTKLETVPWHPMAPTGSHMPNGCYFECHLGLVILEKDYDSWRFFIDQKVKFILQDHFSVMNHTAKLSSNAFKKHGEKRVYMLTIRSYDCRHLDDFLNLINEWKFFFNTNRYKTSDELFQIEVEKEIVEFAIYDTNINHDKNWIN